MVYSKDKETVFLPSLLRALLKDKQSSIHFHKEIMINTYVIHLKENQHLSSRLYQTYLE